MTTTTRHGGTPLFVQTDAKGAADGTLNADKFRRLALRHELLGNQVRALSEQIRDVRQRIAWNTAVVAQKLDRNAPKDFGPDQYAEALQLPAKDRQALGLDTRAASEVINDREQLAVLTAEHGTLSVRWHSDGRWVAEMHAYAALKGIV